MQFVHDNWRQSQKLLLEIAWIFVGISGGTSEVTKILVDKVYLGKSIEL
jgi:hypothetical protein